MTIKNTLLFATALIVATGLISAVIFAIAPQTAQGSAPSGLPATVATSGPLAITTASQTIIATSTDCAARIVSTNNQPLKLTFGDADGDTPTGTNGIWQGASTTVSYDGGLYGCGAVKAFSYAAQTIYAVETR